MSNNLGRISGGKFTRQVLKKYWPNGRDSYLLPDLGITELFKAVPDNPVRLDFRFSTPAKFKWYTRQNQNWNLLHRLSILPIVETIKLPVVVSCF